MAEDKVCGSCNGTGRMWETSRVDNLFQELVYCYDCKKE